MTDCLSTRNKGTQGETLAVAFLRKNGFEIVAQNYSRNPNFQGGEIDIIAKRAGAVHFVEVKSRANDRYGTGRESVTKRKQTHLRAAATHWLVKNGLWDKVACQFDVIEITGAGAAQSVELFENCF